MFIRNILHWLSTVKVILNFKTGLTRLTMIHQCSMKKMINCTLVGDGMVGKTSLARVFAGQNASEKYEATVFNNFAGFTKVGEDQYTVNIFDSAGEVSVVQT